MKTLSERQEKKAKELEKKIHLEIAYLQIQRGVIKNIEEYQERSAELVKMVLNGELIYHRTKLELDNDTISQLRAEVQELTTHDEDDEIDTSDLGFIE